LPQTGEQASMVVQNRQPVGGNGRYEAVLARSEVPQKPGHVSTIGSGRDRGCQPIVAVSGGFEDGPALRES